MWFIHQNYKFV